MLDNNDKSIEPKQARYPSHLTPTLLLLPLASNSNDAVMLVTPTHASLPPQQIVVLLVSLLARLLRDEQSL